MISYQLCGKITFLRTLYSFFLSLTDFASFSTIYVDAPVRADETPGYMGQSKLIYGFTGCIWQETYLFHKHCSFFVLTGAFSVVIALNRILQVFVLLHSCVGQIFHLTAKCFKIRDFHD